MYDIFSNEVAMKTASFIKSQHPNANLRPSFSAVSDVLARGWVGQKKMNGHRLQIHIEPSGKLTAYTRQGSLHTHALSEELKAAFKDYADKNGAIVFEGEWLKTTNEVYLFDCLKLGGKSLMTSPFKVRFEILKTLFRISPNVKILMLLRTPRACMMVLDGKDDTVEGLVFKSMDTKGWPDSAIVRCLKKDRV